MRPGVLVIWTFNFCFCEKTTLNLLVLLPYFNIDPSLNPSWADGDNVYPALQLARDQINKNPNILQHYTLELIKGETGCEYVEETMVNFVNETYQSKRKKIVGLLGPGCSSSAIALAPVTSRKEVSIVMVHGGGSQVLENRARYFYSIGSLGSGKNIINGLIYLAKKWDKIAILYDESRRFYSSTESFLVQNEDIKSKVKLLTPISFQFLPLDVIQEMHLRVVFVLCPPELTRHLICLAWNKEMVYDDYQYVFLPHSEQNLVQSMAFTYRGQEIVCSEENMQDAINKQFLLAYSLVNSDNSTLDILNTSVSEYLKKYEEYRELYNSRNEFVGREAEYSHWTTYFYDSMWAWALVLDKVTREDPNFFDDANLYGNSKKAMTLLDQFYDLSFDGVSGKIHFDNSTGYVARSSQIIQFEMNGPLRKRGRVIAEIESSNITVEYHEPIQIHASFEIEYIRESQLLSWLFIITDIFLLVFTVVMEFMTLKFRHDAAIKASTPKLLHMSYVGIYIMLLGQLAVLLYSAIPFEVMTKEIFCCISWAWTLPIGFTLSMGPVAMRTWRLYRIFIHYMNPGWFISNKILVASVLALLTVDAMVGSLWTGWDTITTSNQTLPSYDAFHNKTGLKTLRNQVVCTSEWYQWWLILIIINKSLLLLCLIVLVFLTRKIRKRSFTTNSLRILVYAVVIVLTLGISLWFVLNSVDIPHTYNFAALSLTVILMVIIFIACVFMPPLLPSLKPLATEIYLIWSPRLKSSRGPFSTEV